MNGGSGKLSIELQSRSWNPGVHHAAVAEVVQRARSKGAGTYRETIPLAANAEPRELSLTPGDYTIRLFLPNGDVVAESVTVDSDSRQAVSFELPESPHEWLGQELLLGAIQRLPSEARWKALEAASEGRKFAGEMWAKLLDLAGASVSAQKVLRRTRRKARTRVEHALDDLARNCAAIDRISGAGQVSRIRAQRFVSHIDRERAMPADTLEFPELVRWWMGEGRDDGQTLMLIEHDERNAKWEAPPGDYASVSAERRAFAQVLDPTGVLHVAVLPEGWRMSARSSLGAPAQTTLLMTVLVDSVMQARDKADDSVRWACSASVDDTEFMTFLGFLYSGQSAAANALLSAQAQEFLFEKTGNPLAAAARAYGLLSFPETRSASIGGSWRQWIGNLYSRFTALPDGAIAMARLYLRYGGPHDTRQSEIDVEKLRDYVLEAVRRGMPYYTIGYTYLSEMLALISTDDESARREGERVEATRVAQRLVNQLGRVIVPGKLFTVLRWDASSV